VTALTGYRRDEVMGRECTMLQGDACFTTTCTNPDQPCGLWEKGVVRAKRCTLRHKDGHRVPVIKNATLLHDAEGTLVGAVETALNISDVLRLEEEVANLRHQVGGRARYCCMIGRHPVMQQLYDRIELAAQSDASVLVYGETGTGKELVAQAIHRASPRKTGPFVRINCAALPETLMESELFGHVRGAFTGAVQSRQGRFEAADGGTLLLDEIGDVPSHVQGKLLRVLQEHEIERLGENQPRQVDIRVVAATNCDLQAAVRDGQFREDLYFRVAVIPIKVPPLRDRTSDIPLLVDYFLERIGRTHAAGPKRIAPAALQALMAYAWPGNVRELEHALEYAYVLSPSGLIGLERLPPAIAGAPGRLGRTRLTEERIQRALRQADGHRGRAAEALGVSRVTLWKWMKRLGISD
jgi:transcriptional regulator with PAS, ATPase and Fis domain